MTKDEEDEPKSSSSSTSITMTKTNNETEDKMKIKQDNNHCDEAKENNQQEGDSQQEASKEEEQQPAEEPTEAEKQSSTKRDDPNQAKPAGNPNQSPQSRRHANRHNHHATGSNQFHHLEPVAASAGLSAADYLAQLVKDKKQLSSLPPNVFIHVPRLIDEEINNVRQQLFQLNDVVRLNEPPLELPEPEGELIQLQEKLYVPVDEHPEYNFVGRLLGPRGMTAKQLEQETGCKIMIRGRGSMRDKKKVSFNWRFVSLFFFSLFEI